MKGGSCKVCKLTEPKRRAIALRYMAGEGPKAIASDLPPAITERVVGYHVTTCEPVDRTGVAQQLGRIAKVLDDSGIPPEEIARVTEISLGAWQGFHKTGPKGEERAVKVDLERTGVKLTPKWADGPAWPVVQPIAPPRIGRIKAQPKRTKGDGDWKRGIILPDPQIGYRRLESGELDPFHDNRAMDVALQITSEVDPDLIVNLGDFLDLSEASRFLQEPGFAQTTQASLTAGGEFLAQQRAASSEATRIIYIEGNHDYRLKRSILENAAWAFGLKRTNVPPGWPVLSVPNLLAFDELGVEFVEGYPAGIFYVNDNFACVHGERVRSGGSTAAAIIDDERVSLACGHVHRIEQMFKTVRTPRGPKTRLAASMGCLCRIDGAVPSTKTGVRHDGRSPDRIENWQQAMGVVTYQEGDGQFSLEIVPIFGGTAIYRGDVYESSVTPDWARKAA